MTSPEPSTTVDAANLAKFGYQQSMERRTGRFASFAVAFAFVSIATGIYLLFWVDEYRRFRSCRRCRTAGRWRPNAHRGRPHPVYRAPWSLVADADPAGGDVTVSFA